MNWRMLLLLLGIPVRLMARPVDFKSVQATFHGGAPPHSLTYQGDSETATIQAEIRKANDLPIPHPHQPCSAIPPQRVEKEVETFLKTIFPCPQSAQQVG